MFRLEGKEKEKKSSSIVIVFTYPARLGTAWQSKRQKPACKSGRVSVKHRCGLEVRRSRVRVIFRIDMRYQCVNTAAVLGVESG
jgi:hypothetical protein